MNVENIFSKVEPQKLLHFVYRLNGDLGRTNLIPEDNFLQCSFLSMDKGTTFKPHKHLYKERSFDNMVAQESWVVIRGKVRCIFYDLDDKILCEKILSPGDASFTLHGGHNYEALENETLVYEYKTGPYEGVQLDKVFIGDQQ